MRKLKKNINSFTLIEMLAVLAIMGMVLAISVPAFDAAIRTSKVSEGAKLIYRTLEYARQYAVTHGTDCMVVFATSSPEDSDYEMAYKAYKIYLPDEGNTVEDWQFLFRGIEIDSGSSIFGDTTNIPFPGDNDGDTSVAYVRFTPAGKPTAMNTIRVIKSNDVSESDLFREITYFSTTGRIRLKDLGVD